MGFRATSQIEIEEKHNNSEPVLGMDMMDGRNIRYEVERNVAGLNGLLLACFMAVCLWRWFSV